MSTPDSTPSADQQAASLLAASSSGNSTSAVLKWQGAGKAVSSGIRLSQQLTTLRDQLGGSAFVDWQQLKTLRHLGQGSFAEVGLCSFQPSKSGALEPAIPEVVAVKQIRTELLGDSAEVATFVEEVKLLRKLKHKCVPWRLLLLCNAMRHSAGWPLRSLCPSGSAPLPACVPMLGLEGTSPLCGSMCTS
jgi:hypothetical protein